MIPIPFYLKDHLSDVRHREDITSAILTSAAGNTDLEVYYSGDLCKIKNTLYITDGEYPCLIVAKDPVSGEEFVVFDGARHGYDPMFCNEPIPADTKRALKRYEPYSGKIRIQLGYSIDYEDEKEEYAFDEDGKVRLMYGSMDWEEAKSIGFDWISLKFVDTKKEFFECELA